ncbi:hypothetical protein EJB05_36092, partial [Eragrostis curvula]
MNVSCMMRIQLLSLQTENQAPSTAKCRQETASYGVWSPLDHPYEKSITSERFRGRIHFEFDKCIACEVCVRVCPIDLPLVDWRFEKEIKKKQLLNYSIDFGVCIFCGNCVEYCPTNCLSMII